MVHERFEFAMPASPEVVFDAFHDGCWRSQWDSLVQAVLAWQQAGRPA